MASSSTRFFLPFHRLSPRNQERLEEALAEALRAHPGATSEVVDQDDPDGFVDLLQQRLEYQLRFPAAAGRRPGQGTLAVAQGEDGELAQLQVAGEERALLLGEALARQLGGFAPGAEAAARRAALLQRPLAGWEEIVACADDHFMVSLEQDGWCTVLVDPDDLVDVSLELFEEEGGAQWLVLRSVVGPEGMLTPEQALEESAVLDFAALSLNNGMYELVYSFPLEALSRQVLRDLLAWLAEEALDLREEHAA